MKNKIVAIAAALMMASTMPAVTAYAEPETEVEVTETVVEEYSYTLSVNSILGFNGSTAVCSSTVNGASTCTKIVATQKLQKKTLWWWTDVETWSKTVNGKVVIMNNSATVTSGGTYRVRVDAVVYSGSNSEAVYANSVEVVK